VPRQQTASRISGLLERVGLLARADDLVEGYSRGMKQRLHLARGLVADARVLFLDEPTSGMDPIAAHDFRSLVRELRAEGRTILLTTHDMAEAESVCDRVTLIDHGRVLAVETPATLSRLVSAHERIDFEWTREELAMDLRDLPGVTSVSVVDRGRYRVELAAEGVAARVLDLLVRSGVTTISTSRPRLEEVYLHLMDARRARKPMGS
jgi:ABC-2 type transport system ATP-binding protein